MAGGPLTFFQLVGLGWGFHGQEVGKVGQDWNGVEYDFFFS